MTANKQVRGQGDMKGVFDPHKKRFGHKKRYGTRLKRMLGTAARNWNCELRTGHVNGQCSHTLSERGEKQEAGSLLVAAVGSQLSSTRSPGRHPQVDEGFDVHCTFLLVKGHWH